MKQARTLSEHRIARDLGEALCRRMVGGCIRDLQRMQGHMLSGDDSGLINTWDEICVQQQIEHSFSWHAYVATMDAVIEYRISQLKPYELEAVWLLTGQGEDWDCVLDDERERYPVSDSDVVAYLQDELLTAATNWSNSRIQGYLDGRYGWE
jgi:hypothetical protein